MAIYRFRVEIEDYEGLYREIEVKSTQTFEDLHYAILRAYSFDVKHPASFFYSDDLWHMEDEIAFKDMQYNMTSDALPMNKTRISEYIDDPHQRFIYVYQSDEGWAFLVELVNIDTNDVGKTGLPMMVKSVGEAPKQYNTKVVVKPAIEKEKAKPAPELLDIIDDETPEAADDLVVFESFEAERSKGKSENLDLDLDLDDDAGLEDEDELDEDEDDDLDGDMDDDDDDFGGSKGKGRGRSSDYDDDY